MKLTRIMKLTEEEIKEIIQNGEITILKGSSWSGEDCKETFEIAEHFDGIEVLLNYEVDESKIERPEDYDKFQEIRRLDEEGEDIPEELEEYADDSKCYENLDEWLNKEAWTLKVSNKILEDIKENGFECWLGWQDTGIVIIDIEKESKV